MKIVNKASMIPIADVGARLNPHIENMNTDGWTLMSATVETVGVQELLLLFWKKEIPSVSIDGING